MSPPGPFVRGQASPRRGGGRSVSQRCGGGGFGTVPTRRQSRGVPSHSFRSFGWRRRRRRCRVRGTPRVRYLKPASWRYGQQQQQWERGAGGNHVASGGVTSETLARRSVQHGRERRREEAGRAGPCRAQRRPRLLTGFFCVSRSRPESTHFPPVFTLKPEPSPIWSLASFASRGRADTATPMVLSA